VENSSTTSYSCLATPLEAAVGCTLLMLLLVLQWCRTPGRWYAVSLVSGLTEYISKNVDSFVLAALAAQTEYISEYVHVLSFFAALAALIRADNILDHVFSFFAALAALIRADNIFDSGLRKCVHPLLCSSSSAETSLALLTSYLSTPDQQYPGPPGHVDQQPLHEQQYPGPPGHVDQQPLHEQVSFCVTGAV